MTSRPEPLRVLLSMDRLGYDNDRYHGAGRLVVEWTRGLLERGVDVTPVILREPGALGRRARDEGLPFVFLERGLYDPCAILDFVRIMRERRIQVAHLQGFGATTFGRLAAAIVGVPVIVHVHTNLRYEPRGYPWYVRVMDRLLAGGTDQVLAVSEYARRFAVDVQGFPPERVRILHNSVDVSRFTPATREERGSARAALGLDESQSAAICVTRFHTVKGVDSLLESWARVAAAEPEARLFLVGEGPLRGEYEALAERLGLADSVRFLGYRQDVREVLVAGDVAVIPSRSEGFCVAGLEALACGIPLVATRAGGNVELVREGINGLLVEPEDPPALAEGLVRLLSDPPLRHRLAARARESAADYDLSRHLATLVDHYRRLGNARGPGRAGGS